MLDSGNLAPSPPLSAPCSVTDAAPAAPNAASGSSDNGSSAYARVLKRTRGSLRKTDKHKSLWDRLTDPQSLPFLVAASKMVECCFCHHALCPEDELLCSVRGCAARYHKECAKQAVGVSNLKKFKCPQHVCFICKQKLNLLRCVRCTVAFHTKCAPWPEAVIRLEDHPGQAVCWRHSDWRLDKKEQPDTSTSDISEVFCRLPLPFANEEFKIDFTWKDMDNKMEPPPYTHIRRNMYLVKKKRSDVDDDVGCTNCSSTCSNDCVCRVQCISCSKACRCSENCSNRPFRREKQIRIVKTEFCGWGVEAVETIEKGEFIIEYIGEVIDDALCEQRLWDMKYKGVQNFYMCEIRKDFTIDATFKGNTSRFLNHSCDPNCVLEKWQVDGETRIGVFAGRSIEVGEPLTYDYRFVQFGAEVKCCCGSPKCQGFLGSKKKIGKVINLCWGAKRKRTSCPRAANAADLPKYYM
ncbi:histone-lysine N-methyltransferase ASHR3 isoform X1 [Medicago truncatula]|nr:histone-lysine N-methyltransferase ASHR3 isoform X1 [Medicago truncatula]